MFSKGDKVRVIPAKHSDTASHLVKGKVYTVVGVKDSHYVELEGEMKATYCTRLELVEPAPDIAQRIEALAQGVRVTPEVHCACCWTKAPRITVKDHPIHGNLLSTRGQVNQPDLRGWLLMTYPYSDPFIKPRVSGVDSGRFGMAWQEVTKVCPKCAGQVMGTVKHMSEGWRR